MGDFADLTKKVCADLDLLNELLWPCNPQRGVIAGPDYAASYVAWNRFLETLQSTADVVRSPKPKQGLAAVWLRALFQRAAKVTEAIKKRSDGWPGVVFNDHNDLFWLITSGPQSQQAIRKATTKPTGILSLIEQPQSATLRLRALAESWGSDDEGTPSDPHCYKSTSTAGQNVRRAGELLLEAIDGLEVDNKWLTDEVFADRIFRYADEPSALISPDLKELSGRGLLQVVGRYISGLVEITPTPANLRYLQSKNHERDEWVYQNIVKYDYKTLLMLFNELAPGKKWKLIEERESFKNSVRRYAQCHNLVVRFFPDDRNISKS